MVEADRFSQLVKNFEEAIRDGKNCWAELFVNEIPRRATVSYLPEDGVIIRGMHTDLPPYMVIFPDKVFLDSEHKSQVTNAEEAEYYQVLRSLLDPRALRSVMTEAVESSPGDWERLRYDRQQIILPQSAEEVSLSEDPKYDFVQEARFSVEDDRLFELQVWDNPPEPQAITLRFHYDPALVSEAVA